VSDTAPYKLLDTDELLKRTVERAFLG
jgi:hypothetical protein